MPINTLNMTKSKHPTGNLPKSSSSVWWASQAELLSVNSLNLSEYCSLSLICFNLQGLISDLVKNKYKLPRSYLLVPIATIFFASQLLLATVDNIEQLWIATSLLGLAHGSLYSLYPTVCLEWFGMGTYLLSIFITSYFVIHFLPCSRKTAHFSENWGYLGMSLLVGGNIFSLVFGQNLDTHYGSSTSHTHSSIHSVRCLNGLDCYMTAIYLTMAATLASIVLCGWAGYREKQKIAKLYLSRTWLSLTIYMNRRWGFQWYI